MVTRKLDRRERTQGQSEMEERERWDMMRDSDGQMKRWGMTGCSAEILFSVLQGTPHKVNMQDIHTANPAG